MIAPLRGLTRTRGIHTQEVNKTELACFLAFLFPSQLCQLPVMKWIGLRHGLFLPQRRCRAASLRCLSIYFLSS